MVDSFPLVLPEDPKEAQKIFNALSVQDQLDTVLRARGKERVHTLFLSEHPEQLVQQLPELEVYLTVKEVGDKDSVDLISLTTPEQFQYILDLDFWKRDQLDPEKILNWMEILLESGEMKVAQFIESADLEFIALLLKKFIQVVLLEGEQLEQMDQLPYFTLDHFYFVDFKGKKAREVFEPFIRILCRVNQETYRKLMDSLMAEIESELEETGYRLRNSRLADYGFPDIGEAMEIYRYINPDSLAAIEKKSVQTEKGAQTNKEGSIYYLTFQNEGPFFTAIFSRIEDLDEQDRLKQEITALCNKAVVADGIDLSNIVGIERAIKKVYHTLNLGLQYLSKEDEIKALDILRSLPMQKLFRAGMSTTLLLRQKAESILKGSWFSNDRENLVLLDPLHSEKFEGILKRRPSFYREGIHEDFEDLQDIKVMDNFLEWVDTVVHFIGKELNVFPARLKELDLKGCFPETWQGITLSVLFLTSLANQILNGSFQFKTIEQARVKDFLSQVFQKDIREKGVIKTEVRDGLRDWIHSIESDEAKRQHLIAFRDFCLDLFEEEYGKIPPEERIDPRFVKGLLVRKS